jgi:hypothetical protein
MPKYKVGDLLWKAINFPYVQVTVPCPVCFGKTKVTVILGNGDEVSIDCNYCGQIDHPTGYVTERKAITSADQFFVDSINVTYTVHGEECEYRSTGSQITKEKDLFYTEEEALAKAEELRVDLELQKNQRVEYLKHHAYKSFSWNAGYWMKKAKQSREEAEYYEKKYTLCKARSKEVNNGE